MGDRSQIYTDQVGRPMEAAPGTGGASDASAVLPMDDFSAAQAALAGISMPFRKTIRDAFLCDVGPEPIVTAINRDLLVQKRCTSFHAVNPNPFWMRLRGCEGPDDLIAEGEGWLWPPGFVGVYSTQYPRYVCTLAVARPGFPIFNAQGDFLYAGTARPAELAYGLGGS